MALLRWEFVEEQKRIDRASERLGAAQREAIKTSPPEFLESRRAVFRTWAEGFFPRWRRWLEQTWETVGQRDMDSPAPEAWIPPLRAFASELATLYHMWNGLMAGQGAPQLPAFSPVPPERPTKPSPDDPNGPYWSPGWPAIPNPSGGGDKPGTVERTLSAATKFVLVAGGAYVAYRVLKD